MGSKLARLPPAGSWGGHAGTMRPPHTIKAEVASSVADRALRPRGRAGGVGVCLDRLLGPGQDPTGRPGLRLRRASSQSGEPPQASTVRDLCCVRVGAAAARVIWLSPTTLPLPLWEREAPSAWARVFGQRVSGCCGALQVLTGKWVIYRFSRALSLSLSFAVCTMSK